MGRRVFFVLCLGVVGGVSYWLGHYEGSAQEERADRTELAPQLRQPPIDAEERTCIRVVDGDTIVLDGGERVRYIGIDTPETKHPTKPVQWMGSEATEANRQLVEGKRVRLEYDVQRKDKYERTLAYVYVGDVMVNERLVRAGYAKVSTHPPNVKYEKRFVTAQQEAREAKLGLWVSKTPAPKITDTDDKPPPKVEPKQPPTEHDRTTVYVTRTGKKYHRDGCQYLRRSKIPMGKAKAQASGYGPCSKCRP